ncbi:MAG: spermidine/putrescine ABC transporter ATP-binding protein, partial [Verrucomicrobia bacterium]
ALSIADRMAILDGGHILQVGSPREVYGRPTCKTVAHFIGETDFIEGKLTALRGREAEVETVVGKFVGVLGDPSAKPAVGASVTLSIRPECWTLRVRGADVNSVRGKIGESIYLGEVAQYGFVPAGNAGAGEGGLMLKVYELNPRHLAGAGAGELHAVVAAEDVVVLER